MQYIVLDLEWNQPLSYSSPAYKSVGGKLLFEMIQIGAVRVDETMRITDSFTQLIRPVHYQKLHPRIRRITHIEQEDLDAAPEFSEAVAAFAAWCGEDYALLTWGCDDVSVLRQNMDFFRCETPLAGIYDVQKLFGEVLGNGKDRSGLKAAMEHFGIESDENMPFHNAVNDAYYTAEVFLRLPEPQKVLECKLTPRKLVHIERPRERQAIMRVRSTRDTFSSPMAMKPPCPSCGRKIDVAEGYAPQPDGRYMALADCPQHGLVFVKLQFGKSEDGKRIVTRTTALSDEQSRAYVATKHLQWRNKIAALAAKDDGTGGD